MSELNYLRIAQILGGTITEIEQPSFGVFGAARLSAERFRLIRRAEQVKPLTQEDWHSIAKAFEKVREGYEQDRVLVDPTLSKQFIAECRRLGVQSPKTVINKKLQAIRKNSSVYGIKFKKTTRASEIEPGPYFAAAELAFVQLNYRREVSVDDIITDEKDGNEFVELCKAIQPSGSAMVFKWAVLRLRKMRSFSKPKTQVLSAVPPEEIERRLTLFGTLDTYRLASVPDEKGFYAFAERNGVDKYLYVGSSDNLRESIEPFHGAEPFKVVAGQFWKPKLNSITVRAAVMKHNEAGVSARDLSLRLIEKRHPLFNMPVHLHADANGEN